MAKNLYNRLLFSEEKKIKKEQDELGKNQLIVLSKMKVHRDEELIEIPALLNGGKTSIMGRLLYNQNTLKHYWEYSLLFFYEKPYRGHVYVSRKSVKAIKDFVNNFPYEITSSMTYYPGGYIEYC